MSEEQHPSTMPDQSANHSKEPPTKILDTKDLFEGRSVVLIAHAGSIYRLQIKRNGKLILQK